MIEILDKITMEMMRIPFFAVLYKKSCPSALAIPPEMCPIMDINK